MKKISAMQHLGTKKSDWDKEETKDRNSRLMKTTNEKNQQFRVVWGFR
jgi:hypothetical protein